MKKFISSLVLTAALALSSQAASLTLVSSAGANGGTNVVFSNAVVLTSITVQNVGGTNLNFALFNSMVRSNQYAVGAFSNVTFTVGSITNTFTNFNTGTLGSNIYTGLIRTTNVNAATVKSYPMVFGPVTVMTNQNAVTYTFNQYLSHGLVMTNNQQAAGVCAWTFNYLTPQ